jgi:hypothetical protein
MGKYDDINEDQLRGDLVRFAELILRLNREGALLASPADLQTMLGELRQKIFAWEVRASRRLQAGGEAGEAPGSESGGKAEGEAASAPEPVSSSEDRQVRDSLRIVRDALRREEELLEEWEEGLPPDEEDDASP